MSADPWLRVLALSVGGMLGVNARYGFTLWLGGWVGPRFPWATVAINVIGSFAAGVAAAVLAARVPHPLARLFVIVGFLGGFTTFSAFSLESLTLWERGELGLMLANMLGSVVAGFAAVALGAALARGVLSGPAPPTPSPPSSAAETPAALGPGRGG